MCRFINADEYTSTGQDFLGYNMFAYCNNNPCNCADTRGNQAVKNTATMTSDSGYNGYARTYIELKKIEQISDSASLSELVSYIMNTDEDAVLNAEHIAFYKGAPVMLIDGTSSFSFGVIIMGRDGGERLLRHEYGHVRQLSERGVGNYLTTVVIPSVVCFQFANNDKMTWETYYSLPWEYQASSYGGADFAHKPWADSIMSIYSRIVG